MALASAALPDVILMDINLPGLSGIDALKALREDVATAHIPVEVQCRRPARQAAASRAYKPPRRAGRQERLLKKASDLI